MLKDQVIQILKKDGGYVSGSYIAELFDISRMTVNNAVKELIADGYEISAVRNRGYKIEYSPNAYNLIELADYIGNTDNIHFLPTVTSTNDYLKELAKEGAEEGTVVFADRQTDGKGRLGRNFFSPSRNSIYLSYLYRPKCKLIELKTLTARVAVAVWKAIDRVCGIQTDIKWVNDLLLNEKKVCGILTELSIIGEGMKPDYAIVGVGINVNNERTDFEGELRLKASSLYAETGTKYCRSELVAAIINNLRVLFDGNASDDMDFYREHCYNIGKKAVFEYNDDVVTGIVEGIDNNNGLIVKLNNETITLSSGTVSIKTSKGYC